MCYVLCGYVIMWLCGYEVLIYHRPLPHLVNNLTHCACDQVVLNFFRNHFDSFLCQDHTNKTTSQNTTIYLANVLGGPESSSCPVTLTPNSSRSKSLLTIPNSINYFCWWLNANRVRARHMQVRQVRMQVYVWIYCNTYGWNIRRHREDYQTAYLPLMPTIPACQANVGVKMVSAFRSRHSGHTLSSPLTLLRQNDKQILRKIRQCTPWGRWMARPLLWLGPLPLELALTNEGDDLGFLTWGLSHYVSAIISLHIFIFLRTYLRC